MDYFIYYLNLYLSHKCRMEEYGYIQNELGEWVPMDDTLIQENGSLPPVPSLSKQASVPGSEPHSASKNELSDSKTSLNRGNSKDGFSSLFSDNKSGSEKSLTKSSLPPRPDDYKVELTTIFILYFLTTFMDKLNFGAFYHKSRHIDPPSTITVPYMY